MERSAIAISAADGVAGFAAGVSPTLLVSCPAETEEDARFPQPALRAIRAHTVNRLSKVLGIKNNGD
jgi:hypothetical protein